MNIPGFLKWGFGLIVFGVVIMILSQQPNAGDQPFFWFGIVFILIGVAVLTRPIWRRKLAERAARR